jgi:hypothetical protein
MQPPASPGSTSAVEEVDGVLLYILETSATAGDVILMHPLLLHAPPTAHLGSRPRLLLTRTSIVEPRHALRL